MAFDGQKGLEMASSENPDIILLDMTGCDEYDTKPIEFKRLLGKINDMIGA
jgi:DNA-binding response OmpR family regulator